MKKVAIVTDSTSFLPAEKLAGLPISIAPLQVIFGENVYLDGVDITPERFYQRLKTDSVHPSTSQVTPESFSSLYKKLLEKGYDILSIVISSKLSGTMESAILAQAEFPGAPIKLVDSLSTSMGLGFQVLSTARLAEQGASLDECYEHAQKTIPVTGAMFTLNTLTYLHRGGRIGGAAAFLGTAFDLKPILEIKDGKVAAVEKVRSRNKSIERLVELFVKKVQGYETFRVGYLIVDADEEIKLAYSLLRNAIDPSRIREEVFSGVSPVIGTHAGPGTLGLAFMLGM